MVDSRVRFKTGLEVAREPPGRGQQKPRPDGLSDRGAVGWCGMVGEVPEKRSNSLDMS